MQPRILIRVMCVAALCAAAVAHAQSTVYRWVDKNGKVQFSDSPPTDAKDYSQKRMGGGQVDEGQVPFATQIAARRHPVTLYVSDDCGDICAQGRDLLARRGVPYSEKNAQKNPADAEAVKKAIGVLEVPVLLVGANAVKGYAEESWQSALDQAGYARTRLPGQPGPRPSDAAVPQEK